MACEGFTFDMVKQMTESEKNRMLAIVINAKVTEINWDQVTKDLGSASANSVRTCMINTRKKYGAAAGTAKSPEKATKPSTPRKPKGASKKRKGDLNGDDLEEPTSPSKVARKEDPSLEEPVVKDEGHEEPIE